MQAVDLAVAFVPVAHHRRRDEALHQVRHCWHVLPFLKKQLGGNPQDSVQVGGALRAHKGCCKVAGMIDSGASTSSGQCPAAMSQVIFTDKQLQELQEPLSQQVVKTRSAANGRNLSYIEGWWAIHEANRIFGFGCWEQEILDIKCVLERERKIGRDQRNGWGVSYIASIRVTVNGVKREGVGAGHGIDVDLGLAHESAVKEAATDAMKRAFMTFGNQFGLALYDKDQRNVEDKPPNLEQISESEKAAGKFVDALMAKMEQTGVNTDGIRTLKAILQVVNFEDVRESLRPKLLEKLTAEYAEKLNLGQNAKGEQIVQIATKEIAESTAKLQNAVEGAFS